jgi:uncharacterized protein with FMN-binding domain
MKPQDKILVVLGSVAIVGVAGFGGYALFTGKDSSQPAVMTSTQPVASSASGPTIPATATTNPTTAIATYADGTYVATVRYYVPDDGQNTLNASVTISNGAVSAASATDTYRDRKSKQYVDSFESGISSAAVGQPVANLSIGRIGGASLTSSAFNDALDTIRNEAQA